MEGEKLALSILKQIMEEKITDDNVEIAAVTTADRTFRIYPKQRLHDILNSL